MRRLSFFTLCAAVALSAAGDTRIATRDWVVSSLRAKGVRISTATATTNGAAVTYSCAFSDTNLPGCVSVSFTVSPARLSSAAVYAAQSAAREGEAESLPLQVAQSAARKAMATPLAASDTGELTLTLFSGSWIDRKGKAHDFTLPDGGMELTCQSSLPEIPPSSHECTEFNADCVCAGYGIDPESVEIPEAYDADRVLTDEVVRELMDWEYWVDKETWPYVRTVAGVEVYCLVDADGMWTALDNVMESDAWVDALSTALDEARRHLGECAAAYALSAVCTGDGKPVHDWRDKACGGSSWRQCTRNASHVDGTAAHDFTGGGADAVCHRCRCGEATEPHSFGDWLPVSSDETTVTLERICTVCGWSEFRAISSEGLETCNTNLDIHVAADSACGCTCGKYGKGAKTAESALFHKWIGTDANGVTNCLCECEARHVFREPSAAWKSANPEGWCDGVCVYCLTRTRSGGTATEADHTPKPRSERLCGCRCGRYGIGKEHVAAGREAVTQHLHIQSLGLGGVPHCECFGGGKGGQWHWHYPRTACPRICTYADSLKERDLCGHLASGSSDGPERGIMAARPADHTGKAYGCGCACGLCGESNAAEWREVVALHHPAQSADDRCHCSCDARRLVGTGPEGHEYLSDACVCTCGKGMRRTLNACGKCASCGNIHRHGGGVWSTVASTAAEHSFGDSACVCDCGEFSRDHVSVKGELLSTSNVYCSKCGREIARHQWQMRCDRCGESLGTEYFYDKCTCGGEGAADEPVEKCEWCGAAIGAGAQHAADCRVNAGSGGGDVNATGGSPQTIDGALN